MKHSRFSGEENYISAPTVLQHSKEGGMGGGGRGGEPISNDTPSLPPEDLDC